MRIRIVAIAVILCLVIAMPGMAKNGEQKTVEVTLSYINGAIDSPEPTAITNVKIYNSGENTRNYLVRFDVINGFHQSIWMEVGPGESQEINVSYPIGKWYDYGIIVRVALGGAPHSL